MAYLTIKRSLIQISCATNLQNLFESHGILYVTTMSKKHKTCGFPNLRWLLRSAVRISDGVVAAPGGDGEVRPGLPAVGAPPRHDLEGRGIRTDGTPSLRKGEEGT